MKRGQQKWERDVPIHGRIHDVGFVLVMLADNMALKPPIHWIIFLVVDIIGLVPLMNLPDGLRLGGVYPLFF